jgi:2-C-methyl-D-erythritol 4-phosphate cytidylyltransferase
MSLITPSPARFHALIPCAGSGSRAGTAQPKQYQIVAGLPMVVHTLRALGAVTRLTGGLVVVSPDDLLMAGTLRAHPQPAFEVVGVGGATRAQSVLAGLRALHARGAQPHDWVLVHDAARCLVTPAQINALIDACQDDAVGGLLAHQLADTLKTATTGRVASTVERSDKWLAQTPQMFRLGLLTQALEQAGDAVTDESSALEAMGLQPRLVQASAQNFKVTYPEDFALAEAILKTRSKE